MIDRLTVIIVGSMTGFAAFAVVLALLTAPGAATISPPVNVNQWPPTFAQVTAGDNCINPLDSGCPR